MDGQAKRECKIREEAEEILVTQLQKIRDSSAAFGEVLAYLEDLERDARLTSNTVATPIYASGIIQAYLEIKDVNGALKHFRTLIKRRSQTNDAIVRCSSVLEDYLRNNYDDKDDYEVLEPLLLEFTELIGSLIVAEVINVRQSIRLLRIYRAAGKRESALKIAENLSSDVAAALPYIERIEATLEQLETALYFDELVLADILFNRIKEKTLVATTAAVYHKGDLEMGVRLGEAQRRYYIAQYLIALGDNRMDAICRAAWSAASTYLTTLNDAKLAQAIQLSNDDLMKCATLLSTAAVAGLLAGFSRVLDIVEKMRASTIFSENISYCTRSYRCISSLIHPFAKCIFRRSLHPWKRIEHDFVQGKVCALSEYIPLPDSPSYDLESIKLSTYCSRIELSSYSIFSINPINRTPKESAQADLELLWNLCKSSYVEEFVIRIMPFYESTTIDSLAGLAECDPVDVELSLISYDGYLAIDRPQRTIQMSKPLSTDEQLSQWLANTRKAVIDIAKISQLIEMDIRFD